MIERKRQTDIISRKLDGLRNRFARHVLFKGWMRAVILLIVAGFVLSVAEGFRYFPGNVRKDIVFFYVAFGLIFVLSPVILSILIRRNRTVSFSDQRLARRISTTYDDIRDSLMNALELRELLETGVTGFSRELAEQSIEKVAAEIKDHSFQKIVPVQEIKIGFRRILVVVFIFFATISLNPDFFMGAGNRLLHPEQKFEPILPFSIQSKLGTYGVLGGDSAEVVFLCRGKIPSKLRLTLQYPDFRRDEMLSVDSLGVARFGIDALRENVIYEAYVENRSPFKPWKRIGSGADTIFVTNRPEIVTVDFTYRFPAYTGLGEQCQESNKTELEILPGTQILLKLRANKRLISGELVFKDRAKEPLSVGRETATVTFSASREDQFQIFVRDEVDVANFNPVTYQIRILPDAFPGIALLSPSENLDLNESMEIPIGVRISDDFGFSRVAIHYRLIKKYSPDEQKENDVPISLANPKLTLQELYHVWNVGDLGLSPEDEIEFRIDVFDNDVISGPKRNSTKTIVARFPSLNDLFAETNARQDEVYSENEEVLKQIESTKEILEKVSMELLKDPNIKWEQKTQIEQELKKTKEAGEKLAELSDRLENIVEQAKENQLFSPETLEKYMKLQQAFQDVMTPELKEAMEKLRKALEKMDAQQIQAALKNFKTTQEQFSKELDRLLELFKRIRIEQSVQELAKRFDDLTKRQEQITEQLEKTSATDERKMAELADEEAAIKHDEEIAEDLMKKTAEDMSDFPLMPNSEMEKLLESTADLNIPRDLNEAQKSMKKGNRSQSAESSQRAREKLSQTAESMKEFQQSFNRQAMDEVMGDFQKILAKTLSLSQRQETLGDQIRNTPYQSDRLMDVAVFQQQLYSSLSKIVEDMIGLSNKTFGVTPNISKGFGQASSAMRESIRQMEERNTYPASQASEKATEALNHIAQSLISAMDDLQQSGSSSGFENYLKQLQQMAGQQQGINGETQMLQLGSSAGQAAALQRLAARQQQVQKSLKQLQEEMNQSDGQKMGDLGGIAKEMEDVIKELQSNQLMRKTLDRQQRILSRLLDAQKSLRTQGFKDERKSKTGEEVARRKPGVLPNDRGERRSVLQENLEKALKDGYSKENEEIIRRYFESLSDEVSE
ncbi:MAG: DUF4175 family protein [Candidatus Neomarinimicrobiota bacterium]